MALSSGCSPLGSLLIVFPAISFWKVCYVIHAKKKSACAHWNQSEHEWTLFVFFVAQNPLRRDLLFSLPLILFFVCFCLFVCFVFLFLPEWVSWRGGGDGGGREEGVNVTEWVRSLWAPRKGRGPKYVTSVKIPLLWHFAAFHLSFMVKVTSSIIYTGTYYFLPCIAGFTLTTFHPFIQF